MKKVPSQPFTILCPQHPSRSIERVDPASSHNKTIYCAECILQHSDATTLYKTLPTIPDFLSTIAASSAHHQARVIPMPSEYLEILYKQTQGLERLNRYYDSEKKGINTFFAEITKNVSEILTQKKLECLKVLEEKVATHRSNHDLFGKEIMRSYPDKSLYDLLFPTKEELTAKLNKISRASDLEEFIKTVEKISQGNNTDIIPKEGPNKKRKQYLDDLNKKLKEVQNLQPIIDVTPLSTQIINDNFKVYINKLVESLSTTKDSSLQETPRTISPKKPQFESTVINEKSIPVIKTWFPQKYSLALNLLYRGSRDGMSSQAFHSLCDGKGPTLTLMKGQFEGSSDTCIIGGYLDKDWNSQGEWICSNEAFIFSLSLRRKCIVLQEQFAAMGHAEYGPIFGQGGDLCVDRNFSRFSVNPGSYQNAAKIVRSEMYGGSEKIAFMVEDIEVFSLR